MPLLQINSTHQEIQSTTRQEIHLSGAAILSEQIGKPIEYCMVVINTGSSISFAQNQTTPCAYMEVKNVGKLSPEKTLNLSLLLTKLVSDNLDVDPNRVYIEFQESERHLWGWNGKTFA